MSIRHANDTSKPLRTSSDGSWVRPADWPALPWIADATQGFVGLIAVNDTRSEHLSLLCAGNYTVDWGDGSAAENIATGVKASHTYDYATLATALTSRGYKTAIVTVTANGGNITTIDLNQKHASSGTGIVATPWLDVQVNAVNLTSLRFGATIVAARLLESLHIRAHALTALTSMCDGCYALQAINDFGVQNVTTAASGFKDCRSMIEFPPFNWASLVTAVSLHNSCYSMRRITSTEFPNATDGSNMYQSCISLEEVPGMRFPKLASSLLMFGGCYNLKKVGALHFEVLGSSSRMFENDYALEEVALFNTGTCTNGSSMLAGCGALKNVPAFNLSSATNAATLLNGANSVQWLPMLLFGSAFSATNIVQNMHALKEIPAWDWSGATTIGVIASGSVNISRSLVTGVKVTHSYASLNLSATALNEIFTNLASGVTGQTITITGNPGAATCDTSIATAKGWTVVT